MPRPHEPEFLPERLHRQPTPTPEPQLPQKLPTFVPRSGTRLPELPANSTISLPVPEMDLPPNMTNVLLLGIDEGGTNADAIIIVAINRDTQTAAMMSIPRDTYLYIPEIGHRGRINSAFSGGVERVKQTILYNFGIPIHYYALIDFDGFKQAVDIIGGVDLPISCRLTDWRLKSPDLDPDIEDNWERFTLEPGIHTMDGEFAPMVYQNKKVGFRLPSHRTPATTVAGDLEPKC